MQGDNVRGWNVVKTGQGESLDIALLRPAKDREELTLRLWRAGGGAGSANRRPTGHWRSQWHTVGQGDSPIFADAKTGTAPAAQFDVPAIGVPEAVLHTGGLTIRRSGLLDVRTLSAAGLARADIPPDAAVDGRRVGSDGPAAVRVVPLRGRAFRAAAGGRAGGGQGSRRPSRRS